MGNKGTIGFNAPEQFVTIWQDESCDVYRSGMIFSIFHRLKIVIQ